MTRSTWPFPHESYFLRYPQISAYLRSTVLPDMLIGKENVVIGSIPCSYGLEALTLAYDCLQVISAEEFARGVRIEGYDINQRVVSIAQQGLYLEYPFPGEECASARRYSLAPPDPKFVQNEQANYLPFESMRTIVQPARTKIEPFEYMLWSRAPCKFEDATQVVVKSKIADRMHFAVADATNLGIENWFNLLVSCNLNPYLDDGKQPSALKSMIDSLKPGGLLLQQMDLDDCTGYEALILTREVFQTFRVYRKPIN